MLFKAQMELTTSLYGDYLNKFTSKYISNLEKKKKKKFNKY